MLIKRVCLLVVIGILFVTASVQATPVKNGLVVYYNGSLSGSSVMDLSGNNNNGAATGVTQGIDPEGKYYINLGVSKKITVPKNTQTNISSPISIEFYGTIHLFNQYSPIAYKYTDAQTGWYLSCSQADPFNHVWFGGVVAQGKEDGFPSNNALNLGQRYHIVATFDNSIAHIYINGVESGSDTWNTPLLLGNENIIIGGGNNQLNSNNNISMYTFRLYNRALSSSEVLQNYEDVTYDNIATIKKLAYGDRGLPRYMGSYAINPYNSGLNLFDNALFSLSSVGTPFYQNNGGLSTNCSWAGATINGGSKWKDYYGPGSSAILTYTGPNRNVQIACSLTNDSFDLTHSVMYSGKTQTVQDGVSITGGKGFEFYGDGLNTISNGSIMLYTDNGIVQTDVVMGWNNSSGKYDLPVKNNYQTRDGGVTRSSSLEIPLSSPQLTPMPVPSGYLGALMFAEHADAIDHDSLRTLMYGTNDTNNVTYGKKGFIGHNLNATWSSFAVSSSSGEGLDNPIFKSINDDMKNHGFEIVPHNLIGETNDGIPNRNMAITYLPWYSTNYSCRNWIDHGLGAGARNIGLASLGRDRTNSSFYVLDLFQNYSITYSWLWDADPSPGDGSISTSKLSSVGLPADIVWQNTNLALPNGTPLYQWKACAASNKTALNYYTNSSIDNMLSKYGVSIWHDYWADNSLSGNQNYIDYYYIKGQPCRINATFDGLLTNISKQRDDRKLWNPTVSQYIDYWIAAKNVDVKCTGTNSYTVVNNNSGTVNGFALRVSGSYTPKLDGDTLSKKTNGADTIFWMDLRTGTHIITLES
jgi:hypothetical protein